MTKKQALSYKSVLLSNRESRRQSRHLGLTNNRTSEWRGLQGGTIRQGHIRDSLVMQLWGNTLLPPGLERSSRPTVLSFDTREARHSDDSQKRHNRLALQVEVDGIDSDMGNSSSANLRKKHTSGGGFSPAQCKLILADPEDARRRGVVLEVRHRDAWRSPCAASPCCLPRAGGTRPPTLLAAARNHALCAVLFVSIAHVHPTGLPPAL